MYSINEFILKPLKKNIQNLPSANLVEIKNKEDLLLNLYQGFTIIKYKNKFVSFETKETLNSNITESSNEKTIKGPKDAFTENYQTNLGLIRKRIRSKDLIIKEFMIGSKSNTKVSMIYLNSCDKDLVNYIDNNLSNINIDYVINSNSIINSLNNKKYLFPNYIMTERPDLASFNIIKNKIIILTENTPQVIILPSSFMDYISNIDDNYQNSFNVLMTKIIRFFSFFLSIIIPGYYLA
jgi:spore germination protein KA